MAFGIWPPCYRVTSRGRLPLLPYGGSGCSLDTQTTVERGTLGGGSQFFFRSLASMVKGGLGTVVMVPEDELDRGTVSASEDAGLSDGSIVFSFYSFRLLVC